MKSIGTPRSVGTAVTLDLALSLSPNPRKGGAAIWKVLAEESNERPWTQRKDEGMWAALTRMRTSLDRARRHDELMANRMASRMAEAKAQAEQEREALEQRAQAVETLEFSRRRSGRKDTTASLQSSKNTEEREIERRESAAVEIQKIMRGVQARLRRSVEEREAAIRVQESTRLAREKFRRPWRTGAELPATTVDGLWELLKGGHISNQIHAMDLLQLYADVKGTGLDLALSNAVLGNFSGLHSAKDPMEVYPRQVAHIITLLNQNPRMKLVKEELQEHAGSIVDPKGELTPGYEDLGIFNSTRMGLHAFRKTFRCVAILMAIDECHIISHIVWHMTGDVELTKDMGLQVFRQTGLKQPAESPRMTLADFTGLCVAFRVQLPSGRSVLHRDSVDSIFNRALLRIPKSFARRRARLLHEQFEREATKGKQEQRKHICGWTEFSILLQELWTALPEGYIPNPLQMCFACAQYALSMPLF